MTSIFAVSPLAVSFCGRVLGERDVLDSPHEERDAESSKHARRVPACDTHDVGSRRREGCAVHVGLVLAAVVVNPGIVAEILRRPVLAPTTVRC